MIKQFIYISLAALTLSSCGPKEFTPCECNEVKTLKKYSEADKKWCADKVAADANFAKEARDCAIKALGYDPKEVNSSSDNDLKVSGGTYAFVPAKSTVKWKGKKLTGEHSGVVAVKSGQITVSDAGITSGTIVIDMTTIAATDSDDESNANLTGHLMNEDFFATSEFGEASYALTSAKSLGQNNFQLEGNLTVKGQSHPATALVKMVKSKQIEGQVSLAGGLTFDRTKYGIKYGSGKFFQDLGDKTIDDIVSLQLTLVAKSK